MATSRVSGSRSTSYGAAPRVRTSMHFVVWSAIPDHNPSTRTPHPQTKPYQNTAGWIFRAYPGTYKAYLETPDGGVELVKVYEKGEVPKLNQVSKLIREESQVRVC